jgi:hypothetical protein
MATVVHNRHIAYGRHVTLIIMNVIGGFLILLIALKYKRALEGKGQGRSDLSVLSKDFRKLMKKI